MAERESAVDGETRGWGGVGGPAGGSVESAGEEDSGPGPDDGSVELEGEIGVEFGEVWEGDGLGSMCGGEGDEEAGRELCEGD